MNTDTLQVLDRDLAIFGFFIALGRSTQSYLSSNGFEPIDEPIEGFIRYKLLHKMFSMIVIALSNFVLHLFPSFFFAGT